jgi:hypothetical protein
MKKRLELFGRSFLPADGSGSGLAVETVLGTTIARAV